MLFDSVKCSQGKEKRSKSISFQRIQELSTTGKMSLLVENDHNIDFRSLLQRSSQVIFAFPEVLFSVLTLFMLKLLHNKKK